MAPEEDNHQIGGQSPNFNPNVDFLGLNSFVWWFGVVENRLDPLELGRCQVRCFGWHTQDKSQIQTEDLPWAHPVVPYGVKSVQPPPEGTMVFGFFADGKVGQYPILMGTVPGVPEEILERETGFSDPLSVADKRTGGFPRTLDASKTTLPKDTKGIRGVDADPSRYPKYLNEPTTSRLARPVRGEKDGEFDGVTSESIANTTIDIQRKTRVTNVPTVVGVWDEAYPTYAAKFPYNNVTETESGHAFEMDDTYGHERVQLSHRTGSTLEFANTGSTKLKSMSSRQDITMGDQRTYINGDKYETIDGDFYLQVGGKLRISAKSIEIVSGSSTSISAPQSVSVAGGLSASMSGLSVGMSGLMASVSGLKTDVSGAMAVKVSGGVASIEGKTGVSTKAPVIASTSLFEIQEGILSINSCIPNPFPPIPDNPPVLQEFPPVDPSSFSAPSINFPTPTGPI